MPGIFVCKFDEATFEYFGPKENRVNEHKLSVKPTEDGYLIHYGLSFLLLVETPRRPPGGPYGVGTQEYATVSFLGSAHVKEGQALEIANQSGKELILKVTKQEAR